MKKHVPWTNEHTKVVQRTEQQVLEIPCLHIADPLAPKIVETDTS